MPKQLFICAALLAGISFGAHGYTFRFLGQKEPVHTDMAIQAWKCVMEYPDANEFNCDNYTPKDHLPSSITLNANPLTLTESDIYKAAIWADDPVRELSLFKLHKVALWSFRLLGDKCLNLRDGLPDGLRCSTHYGNMQYMHAMEGTALLPAADTQNAILDWLTFAYTVAANAKDTEGRYFLERDHCDYFAADNPSKFQQSMMPAGPDGFPCGEDDTQTPWKTGTVFSFDCWLRSATCWAYSGANDPRTRKAALGAILHAVQDSYAKGHTSRGNDTPTLINQFECSAIVQFQVYSQQNHETHGNGDSRPQGAPNCSDPANPVHGPITASAEVLRLFGQNASPDVLRQYLADHVFPLVAEGERKLSGTTLLMRAGN